MLSAFVACSLVAAGLSQGDYVPSGFRKAEQYELFRRGAAEIGDTSYMVSLVDDSLRIETRVDWLKRTEKEGKFWKPPTSVRFKINLGGSTAMWWPGLGVQVDDGWIVGYDMGEFGGGLYWFAKDEKSYGKISGRNTPMVVHSGKRVYAVQALAHMMFSYSDLVEVKKTATGWTTQLVPSLHVSPSQILWDGARFVYATEDYLSTLEVDGRQKEISRSPTGIGADSMVQRKNGEIWIGASRAVIRLRPSPPDTYSAQWFMPLKNK